MLLKVRTEVIWWGGGQKSLEECRRGAACDADNIQFLYLGAGSMGPF